MRTSPVQDSLPSEDSFYFESQYFLIPQNQYLNSSCSCLPPSQSSNSRGHSIVWTEGEDLLEKSGSGILMACFWVSSKLIYNLHNKVK